MSGNQTQCQTCNKVFSSMSALGKHRRSALYCIAMRKQNEATRKQNEAVAKKDMEAREIIDMRNRIRNLERECSKSQKIISQLQTELDCSHREIDRLEEILKESISRPTQTTIVNGNPTTTNKIENTVNMLAPITQVYLEDQAQFLRKEHIQEGITGYARYALDYPLKNRVVCSDFSRRKVQYRDEQGNIVCDPQMIKLSQDLFKAIRTRNDELIREYTNDLVEMMKYDDSPMLTDLLTEMCALQREVRRLADGQNSEITPTFVKKVCARTCNSDARMITDE